METVTYLAPWKINKQLCINQKRREDPKENFSQTLKIISQEMSSPHFTLKEMEAFSFLKKEKNQLLQYSTQEP